MFHHIEQFRVEFRLFYIHTFFFGSFRKLPADFFRTRLKNSFDFLRRDFFFMSLSIDSEADLGNGF
ncbi:hypothetical protein LEP1GSC071_1743 [Leptospira santarosai str. JET]|nr:hypothetical protein LEP1GSC071_1743 [Leptospira santarosai str. JET]EPG84194.1 hypothetical protein LEP1GSC048_0894 [Leptospira santarosai serovar Shermani str. 1342KT]